MHVDLFLIRVGSIKTASSHLFLLKCLYQDKKFRCDVFVCWGIDFTYFQLIYLKQVIPYFSYTCNKCLSPPTSWLRIPLRQGVLAQSSLYNIPHIPISSTSKTDLHDIAEILLKVSLNTITLFPFDFGTVPTVRIVLFFISWPYDT